MGKFISEHIFDRGNNAHANDVVMQWDVPEPAFFSFSLQNKCCALIKASFSGGAFKISPDRSFLKKRIGFFYFKSIANNKTLTTGIDNNFSANFFDGTIGVLNFYTDAAGAFKNRIKNPATIANIHSKIGGVIEKHLVEFATNNLPGLGAFVGIVFKKVEGLRFFTSIGNKLNAVFFCKSTGFDFFDDTHAP